MEDDGKLLEYIQHHLDEMHSTRLRFKGRFHDEMTAIEAAKKSSNRKMIEDIYATIISRLAKEFRRREALCKTYGLSYSFLGNGFDKMSMLFSSTNFPRMWEIMGYFLPTKFHDRIWIPAIEEQKRKYLEARKKYRTRNSRAILWCAFVFRTIMMFPDCYRVIGLAKLQRFCEVVLPEPVKQWWLGR